MRLEHLSIVHEPSHLLCCRSKTITCASSYYYVHCLCCCKMVAYRTNTAKSLHKNRSFPVRTTLNKFFKTPELNDMQPCLRNISCIVKLNSYLTMAFYSGNWFYSYFSSHNLRSN